MIYTRSGGFADLIFLHFILEQTLGDPQTFSGVGLDAAGLDGAAIVERANSPEAKQALRRDTADAIARGVFGIPTMLTGDELFWGLDQLAYLELFLQGEDPLAQVNFDELGFQGPSAWRTGVSRHGED